MFRSDQCFTNDEPIFLSEWKIDLSIRMIIYRSRRQKYVVKTCWREEMTEYMEMVYTQTINYKKMESPDNFMSLRICCFDMIANMSGIAAITESMSASIGHLETAFIVPMHGANIHPIYL